MILYAEREKERGREQESNNKREKTIVHDKLNQ
jgi:hypothetical protein